jgi:hypothetical protein
MNSEQILLLVAALGVVTISVVTSLGAKKNSQAVDGAAAGTGHRNQAAHANRAQRRKKT